MAEGVARWTSRECDTRHGLLIGLLFAVSILPHTSAVYYYLTSWLPSLFINYTDCSKLICILYSGSCSCLLFVESYSNRVQQIGIPNFVARFFTTYESDSRPDHSFFFSIKMETSVRKSLKRRDKFSTLHHDKFSSGKEGSISLVIKNRYIKLKLKIPRRKLNEKIEWKMESLRSKAELDWNSKGPRRTRNFRPRTLSAISLICGKWLVTQWMPSISCRGCTAGPSNSIKSIGISILYGCPTAY